MALAKMLQVTKWTMARATRVIVTNAISAAAVVPASAVMAAIVIAAATTMINQPAAQPLQRLLPSPTSSTYQSNGDGMGNGDRSDGYGDDGGG